MSTQNSVNYVYTVEQSELCLHSRTVNYVYTAGVLH